MSIPTPGAITAPGADEAGAGERPLFDASILLSQLGGDRQLAATIIESAMGDIPKYLDGLERAVTDGDWKGAARQAHTMKGLTAQIGGLRLAARLKEADDHLRRGGSMEAAAVGDLRGEYKKLTDALERWLGASEDTNRG